VALRPYPIPPGSAFAAFYVCFRQVASCTRLVSGIFALENARFITGGNPKRSQYAPSVAHQAARFDRFPPTVNRWDAMVGSQDNKLIDLALKHAISIYEETARQGSQKPVRFPLTRNKLQSAATR
jgi:hypothetical protein